MLDVLDLLVLVGQARAPLHFLFFVEPLDVHQLRDLREIGIARGHLSSLADALLDLREELAELEREIVGIARQRHGVSVRDLLVDEQRDE